eukprot:365137-Chlamydomonas_euryale.AAC.10
MQAAMRPQVGLYHAPGWQGVCKAALCDAPHLQERRRRRLACARQRKHVHEADDAQPSGHSSQHVGRRTQCVLRRKAHADR